MSISLNPSTICNLYTLDEISAKVTTFQEALESAVIRSYKKDSTQGMQSVESEEMQNIQSVLAVYMKAYELKQGMGSTRIISQNFQGHH